MINMPVELMAFDVAELRQRAEITGDALAAWAAGEIERLQADLKIAKARAAYWEHDAYCCGGCSECFRLAGELEAAEKARDGK